MVELIRDLPQSVQLGLILIMGYALLASIKAAAWFFRDWYTEGRAKALKQTEALLANTMAIQKLELQVERLNEFLHVIPKMKDDINALHSKLRDDSKKNDS